MTEYKYAELTRGFCPGLIGHFKAFAFSLFGVCVRNAVQQQYSESVYLSACVCCCCCSSHLSLTAVSMYERTDVFVRARIWCGFSLPPSISWEMRTRAVIQQYTYCFAHVSKAQRDNKRRGAWFGLQQHCCTNYGLLHMGDEEKKKKQKDNLYR